MDFFQIEVSGMKAANLNTGNLLSYSPYVKVYVGDAGVGRSDIMVRTENPEWKDKLTFTVPQVSNTFIVFKVYDAVLLGDDTLLGFVEVPIRLDNPDGAELTDTITLHDGIGIFEYTIKCTQLPLASLSTVSYGSNSAVDRYTKLGLYRSVLPRKLRSIFLREFENCAYSRIFSNFFAIDAARDFEDLFTTGGHSLSSFDLEHSQADDAMHTDDPFVDENTSPFVIDGRVEGSVVSVVVPPPVALKLTESDHAPDRPVEHASTTTVTKIRLQTQHGKTTEKIVSVDTNRGSLNLPWHDLICTDRLHSDGVIIDILSTALTKPLKHSDSTGNIGAAQKTESNKDEGAETLICRSQISYSELIEHGKASTGVDGEMIIDNKLRMEKCKRRSFAVSVRGDEKWSISHTTICTSERDMQRHMVNPKPHHATPVPKVKPFEWMEGPGFNIRHSTRMPVDPITGVPTLPNPEEKNERTSYPTLKRPPKLSSLTGKALESEDNEPDDPGSPEPAPSGRRLPPPLPPLPQESDGSEPDAPSSPEPAPSDRRLPPPLPPLPSLPQSSPPQSPPTQGEGEMHDVDLTAATPPRRPSFVPPPPPPRETAENSAKKALPLFPRFPRHHPPMTTLEKALPPGWAITRIRARIFMTLPMLA